MLPRVVWETPGRGRGRPWAVVSQQVWLALVPLTSNACQMYADTTSDLVAFMDDLVPTLPWSEPFGFRPRSVYIQCTVAAGTIWFRPKVFEWTVCFRLCSIQVRAGAALAFLRLGVAPKSFCFGSVCLRAGAV